MPFVPYPFTHFIRESYPNTPRFAVSYSILFFTTFLAHLIELRIKSYFFFSGLCSFVSFVSFADFFSLSSHPSAPTHGWGLVSETLLLPLPRETTTTRALTM